MSKIKGPPPPLLPRKQEPTPPAAAKFIRNGVDGTHAAAQTEQKKVRPVQTRHLPHAVWKRLVNLGAEHDRSIDDMVCEAVTKWVHDQEKGTGRAPGAPTG
jgi:hypothetical protein